jgi:ADP-ribose pyrophosphatase YjhB (NUDIX family)
VKGVRPLGGSVEFGETAETTVVREFQEELGITVETRGLPFFIENIFVREGNLGHEVLAIFDVWFPDGAFADATRIAFSETDGTKCYAEWFAIDTLDLPDRPNLFPEGLKARLLKCR